MKTVAKSSTHSLQPNRVAYFWETASRVFCSGLYVSHNLTCRRHEPCRRTALDISFCFIKLVSSVSVECCVNHVENKRELRYWILIGRRKVRQPMGSQDSLTLYSTYGWSLPLPPVLKESFCRKRYFVSEFHSLHQAKSAPKASFDRKLIHWIFFKPCERD